MSKIRHYTLLDQFCLGLDQTLRTLFNQPKTSGKPYPAASCSMTFQEKKSEAHSASLMRINHAGEVCAQALYHGQALVSRNLQIKMKMQAAAIEEGDHLDWCHKRLLELGSHASYLNPLWYFGSFSIGLIAGLIGDQWSLGFLAETETQVIKHLEKQMDLLPKEDQRSYVILQQMQKDEAEHKDEAIKAGAIELPNFIKKGMAFISKVMVKTTYWI